MKKNFFCLSLQGCILLVCLLFWNCSRNSELEKGLTYSSALEISFNVSSVVSGLPEVRAEEVVDIVNNLTIFIFDHLTNEIEFAYYLDFGNPIASNEVDISRWNNERIISIAYSDILNTLNKKRDIHVLANSRNLIENILFSSDLKQEFTFPITEKINYDERGYYMHGEIVGHNFEEKFRAEVMLRRNLARVELTVNTLDKDNMISFLPEDSLIRMQVINVADRAFLMEQRIVSEDIKLIPYVKEELSSKIKNGKESITTTAFYINENYLSKGIEVPEHKATHVVIQVPYVNVFTGEVYNSNYYKLYINKNSPYLVGRNTIYRVTINIKDLGGETDLAAPVIEGDLEVISWSDEVIDTELI